MTSSLILSIALSVGAPPPTSAPGGPVPPVPPPAPTREEGGILIRRRTPVVEVVERAGPAVVNIATEIHESANPFFRRSPSDDLWREFFGGRERNRSQQSLGSGVIIDPAGLVLTNEHVIARAANITIALADRRSFEVDVVGADPQFDLAVLKVRGGARLPAVEIGSSSDLMPGETVVAIGNPFGLANTVTTGVVSALHRSIHAEDRIYEDFIQTDAAINPGNSGGALLNIEGKLIGINTAIYSGGTGIGFAIPVDKARAAVDEVVRYGEVRPAFTGLVIDPRSTGGAIVRTVYPESPASVSGFSPGDRILDVGGQEVRNGRAFVLLERSMVPGQALRVTVARRSKSRRAGEERLTVSLTPRELSYDRAAEIGKTRLGIEVRASRRTLLIERVHPKSDAARVGIRSGDLLLSVAGRRLSTLEEFRALCAAVRDADAVAVVVGRAGRAYYVTLSLGS